MEDEEQKRDPVDVEEAHAAADGAIPHPDGTEAGVVVEKTEEDACCICQDVVHALTQGFLPNCAHRFHFECIVAWAKVTNLCPLCKTKFHSVALHDAHGHIVRTKTICDQKQIFKPNPADHDIAAQLSLVNQARCELCGSGEDEHLLLMCEALGCGVANHTYCIGLRQVPNSSWYCSSHAAMQQRASDAIPRPATTVSTRRRTRRLASLMSNVLGGNRNVDRGNSNFIAVEQEEERRPMRGIAAAYALRMSRELMQVQLRADAMFARGDLTQSSLYGRNTARQGTRSTVSTIDQMWEDQHRSRQEMAAAALAGRSQESTTQGDNGGNSRLSVSRNFAAEYRELAKLMRDAASSDNYASTVTLMIPKTARLRLVSRVKTFFGRLNKKEKAVAIELGCLSVLHQWIRSPEQHDNATSISTPNPQVLDAVLSILETLPIRKEDLVEENGLQDTTDCIPELPDVSIEMRERAIELSEQWRKLNPPAQSEPQRAQVNEQASSPVNAAQNLPVITAFTSPKRPTRSTGKRKRKNEPWSETVVEYVKAKLYPLYKQSHSLTRERFKMIVKQVADLFSHEAASMQSTLLLPSGELSNLAKMRIKKLIDQVYKTSATGVSGSRSTGPTPMFSHVSVPAGTYSAVPSLKHQRRS